MSNDSNSSSDASGKQNRPSQSELTDEQKAAKLPYEKKHDTEKELLRVWRNVTAIPDEYPAWEFNAYMKLAAQLQYLEGVNEKHVEKEASTGGRKLLFLSLRRTYNEAMKRLGGEEGLREQVGELVRREAALRGRKKARMNMAHWGDARYIGTSRNTNSAAAEFFGVRSVSALIDEALGVEPGERWQENLRTLATAHDVVDAMKDYTPPTERDKLESTDDQPADEENGEPGRQPEHQSENIAEQLPQRLDGQQLRGRDDEPGHERVS